MTTRKDKLFRLFSMLACMYHVNQACYYLNEAGLRGAIPESVAEEFDAHFAELMSILQEYQTEQAEELREYHSVHLGMDHMLLKRYVDRLAALCQEELQRAEAPRKRGRKKEEQKSTMEAGMPPPDLPLLLLRYGIFEIDED